MSSSQGIVYRLRQKLSYHLSNDEFEKKVAEINRNEEKIQFKKETFKIKGCKLNFNKQQHAFLLQNFQIFLLLLKENDMDFEIENESLLCKIQHLSFFISTAEELFIIYEIWVDGTYNVIPDCKDKLVVMDVGMNVGLASLFFSTKKFVDKIYAYEPFLPTYSIAELNIQKNSQIDIPIEINNFGLSEKDEEITVNYSPDHRGRTGVWGTELVLDKIESNQKEKLVLKNFNNELSRLVNDNPNSKFILKIDCEGSEYDIFKSIHESLLKPVKCILLEWHKKGPDLIVDVLEKNGFTILSFNPNSKKVGMLYAFK